jgi:hypothetical protein
LVLVNSKTPNKNLLTHKKQIQTIFDPAGVPKCTEEIPLLKDYYQHWQEDYDLEVVLISLDTDPINMLNLYTISPGFPVVISRVGPGECQELLRFGYTHDVLAGQGPENTA